VKLVLVIGSLGRGGSERQIVEFVQAAHPEHARCTVVCLGSEGPLAEQVRASGANVIALGYERIASPRVLVRLARVLRREAPDVVYAMLFWGYCVALPLAALVLPSACRVQGRRSLPEADMPRNRRHERLRWLADRLAHGAIANSLAVGSAVAAHEPSLGGRIWVVPNGIRAGGLSTVPASGDGAVDRDPREVKIVCVANLIPYKGHATLLDALSRLSPRGWSALLVGEGPERAALQRRIVADGMQDRVILLGSQDDVGSLLEQADIAVLPSRSEGLPNAAMEAMAYGLPVIGSHVGGLESLLGSGAGLLVAPGDAVALAQALQRLIEDPSARREMGNIGRDLVLRSLSVESMRDGTLRALREIRRHSGRGAQPSVS
jgi:L-malate glycosyltransferase